MAWRKVEFCEADREVVRRDRLEHQDCFVRQKLDVLWLLHHGLKQTAVCEITGVSRKSVDRYLRLWVSGGLEAVQEDQHYRPTSALEPHRERIVAEFQSQPPRTVAEAATRIEQLTGVRRCHEQVRLFMRSVGLSWRQVAAVPLPPKKVSTSTWPTSDSSSTNN